MFQDSWSVCEAKTMYLYKCIKMHDVYVNEILYINVSRCMVCIWRESVRVF